MSKASAEPRDDNPSSGWSRRGFLQASVGGALAAAASRRALGQAPPGLMSRDRRPRFDDPIVFLVNRITQGFSQPCYETASQLGYAGYLEWQLEPDAIPDPFVDDYLTRFQSLPMTCRQLYDQYTRFDHDGIPYYDLNAATLIRSVYSERQLFERLVEFWTNHFNIHHDKEGVLAIKTVDDREVIRRHALGKFPDLLVASAHSGAMLVYLDNYLNAAGTPQENYARELLELHTLGVDGGYTEADVKEVARCFTGWTVLGAPDLGEFSYDDSRHDQGPKTVLGHEIPPNGGKSDGDLVLQILGAHPSTATFVARKLCVWLLDYDPDPGLVQSVAAIYLGTGGDIKMMVRAILDPMRPRTADVFSSVKLLRPFQFVTALLRALQAEITDPRGVLNELLTLQHYPFGWPTPDGFPDDLASWSSSLLPRWSFAIALLDGSIPGVTIREDRVRALLGDVPDSQLARAIDRILAGGSMASQDVAELQAYASSFPSKDWAALRQILATAAACSSRQYY